jgi:hypothetical protein
MVQSFRFFNKMLILVSLITLLLGCSQEKVVTYDLGTFQMGINSQGEIVELKDGIAEKDYLLSDETSYLISLKIDTVVYHPTKATFSDEGRTIEFDFIKGRKLTVHAVAKDKYFTFEVEAISDDQNLEAVIWGPYYTTINESIGETVGIVQNEAITFGLQALNVKTLGGYPWSDDDVMPQLDIFRQSDYDNLVREEDNPWVLYYVEAAKPCENGSSLQAYTRNRKQERVIRNWGHDRYVAPPYGDGGVVGSKIALFASPTESALATIGEIELQEGLPHPTIEGEWVKTSPIINSSYLIMDFTENNIDECLEVVKKSGFNYLYHGHPFASWGHFPLLKDQFPNGLDGMKACVERAEAEGIRMGTHLLTNFINPTDSYVSPKPDQRLAVVGSSSLVQAVDEQQTEIEIAAPDFFNQYENNHLRSVLVNEEIIRYGAVSEAPPWKLLDCRRGAFGTKASAHAKGDTISKLMDHAYKVFLGNADLNKEIAENIADFMNYTGVRMLDFDGLEGTHSTGMGHYGKVLFAQQWYDGLNEDIKNHYLLGASRPAHYFWHIYSRMNWGEPWYAGFRESQTEYRLRNQKYYQRNLMPGMLGWFKMTSSTSIEDIEWLMARSAGFDAGFAFVTDLESIQKNGQSDDIFSILNVWETARLKGLFSKEQKEKMQDLDKEFRLKKSSEGNLNLTQVYSLKFEHEEKVRQPGEPVFSTFEFENEGRPKAFSLIISAVGTALSDITMEIDRYQTISIPLSLGEGEALKIKHSGEAHFFDANWNLVSTVALENWPAQISEGKHSFIFDASFEDDTQEAKAKIELILEGESEEVK